MYLVTGSCKGPIQVTAGKVIVFKDKSEISS